jgi:hypothetical protein
MIVGKFPITPDMVPPGALLTIWVVYDHPTDFPDSYVARPHFVMDDHSTVVGPGAWVHDDLEIIRGGLASVGLTCLQRMDDDDPVILETWL